MPIPSFYLDRFDGSHKLKYIHAIDTLVPRFAFISKLGIYLGMVCVYQASFTNDRIFRAEQRSTCVGTCQLIARSITCLSPEVNELTSPLPILIFLGANVIALCTCFTMPSDDSIQSLESLGEDLLGIEKDEIAEGKLPLKDK